MNAPSTGSRLKCEAHLTVVDADNRPMDKARDETLAIPVDVRTAVDAAG